MGIVSLDERHKKDLQFLQQLPEEVVTEFVGTALSFLEGGARPSLYNSAARALALDVRQVEAVVEAVAHLFAAASRVLASRADFEDSLALNSVVLAASLSTHLTELYVDKLPDLRAMQQQRSVDLPHYGHLAWRLDIQLATRSLRSQMSPIFVLQLDTLQNGVRTRHYLQADYSNLKHLCDELELALKEMKTPHCSRIRRNIK